MYIFTILTFYNYWLCVTKEIVDQISKLDGVKTKSILISFNQSENVKLDGVKTRSLSTNSIQNEYVI